MKKLRKSIASLLSAALLTGSVASFAPAAQAATTITGAGETRMTGFRGGGRRFRNRGFRRFRNPGFRRHRTRGVRRFGRRRHTFRRFRNGRRFHRRFDRRGRRFRHVRRNHRRLRHVRRDRRRLDRRARRHVRRDARIHRRYRGPGRRWHRGWRRGPRVSFVVPSPVLDVPVEETVEETVDTVIPISTAPGKTRDAYKELRETAFKRVKWVAEDSDWTESWLKGSGYTLGRWVMDATRYGLDWETVDEFAEELWEKGKHKEYINLKALLRFLKYWQTYQDWVQSRLARDKALRSGEKGEEAAKEAQKEMENLEKDLRSQRLKLGKERKLLKTMFKSSSGVNILPKKFH